MTVDFQIVARANYVRSPVKWLLNPLWRIRLYDTNEEFMGGITGYEIIGAEALELAGGVVHEREW